MNETGFISAYGGMLRCKHRMPELGQTIDIDVKAGKRWEKRETRQGHTRMSPVITKIQPMRCNAYSSLGRMTGSDSNISRRDLAKG